VPRAHPGKQLLSRVPGVPSGALLEPLSRAEVSLRLGLRWDQLRGMAPPGEALRMAQQRGPAARTPWGKGGCSREASAGHSGAGLAGYPSPAGQGQGHGLGLFRGRGSDRGLRSGGSAATGGGGRGGGGPCGAELRVLPRPSGHCGRAEPGLASPIHLTGPGGLRSGSHPPPCDRDKKITQQSGGLETRF
jgi:hypothetical protein